MSKARVIGPFLLGLLILLGAWLPEGALPVRAHLLVAGAAIWALGATAARIAGVLLPEAGRRLGWVVFGNRGRGGSPGPSLPSRSRWRSSSSPRHGSATSGTSRRGLFSSGSSWRSFLHVSSRPPPRLPAWRPPSASARFHPVSRRASASSSPSLFGPSSPSWRQR